MKKSIALVLLLAGSMAFGEDLKGKGEMGIFAGGIHLSSDDAFTDPNKAIFGADAAIGILPMVQLFGEYSYARVDQGKTYATANLFTAGAKVNLLKKSEKVEPYALIGFGGLYFTARANNSTETDKAFHLGAGVRVFPSKSKKWGVDPQFRWIHVFPHSDNDKSTTVISYGGGVFFRWGK